MDELNLTPEQKRELVDQYSDELVEAWMGFFRAQRSEGRSFQSEVTDEEKREEMKKTIDAMIRGDESPDPFGPYDLR